MKGSYLVGDDHTPVRARYPVIDAHNHLWGAWSNAGGIVNVMNQVGVACYCDLTANLKIRFGGGGYVYEPADIREFFLNAGDAYPGRYYAYTMASFARPVDLPLFSDAGLFAEECAAELEAHVKMGAFGLKVLKEVGLKYRDASGALVRIDDERLDPVWETAARLGVPVLLHQSDPYGFFQPVTPDNEHYESLKKYPAWSFCGPQYPGKEELLERRDRLLRRHPRTTFILPHVANYVEDLARVGRLLDEFPNACIDCSARCDELGRQPYSSREFFIKYQDRICFGSDMPVSAEMYRFHFRFFETFDEYFVPPDYDGTFGRHRWRVYGLGLPDEVLRKLYFENALRLMPRLAGIYKTAAAGLG